MARRSLRDSAEVGVGTLIIFIAMVLVAAVAAAVIINTTGVLQSKAQSTGREATQDVASNLKVVNVYGVRAAPTDATLWDIDLNVGLSAGSVPVDLTQLQIRWSDGTTVRTYTYNAAALANGAAASSNFALTWIRDNAGTAQLDSGDLVEIHFNNAGLAPRTDIELTLRPGAGSPVDAGFRAAPTYGDDLTIMLR